MESDLSDSWWNLLKKIKPQHKPDAWNQEKHIFNPYYGNESAWNPGRDPVYLNAIAYPPKVTVKNDIFPRPHEIYNCTTCSHGEPEHPAVKTKNPYGFHVKVKSTCIHMNKVGKSQVSDGPRFRDINCIGWERRTPKPKKGYTEGIDI